MFGIDYRIRIIIITAFKKEFRIIYKHKDHGHRWIKKLEASFFQILLKQIKQRYDKGERDEIVHRH